MIGHLGVVPPCHWLGPSHWRTYRWQHCAFVFQQPPNITVLMMFLCQTSIIGLCDELVSGHSSELTNYLACLGVKFSVNAMILFVCCAIRSQSWQLSVLSHRRHEGETVCVLKRVTMIQVSHKWVQLLEIISDGNKSPVMTIVLKTEKYLIERNSCLLWPLYKAWWHCLNATKTRIMIGQLGRIQFGYWLQLYRRQLYSGDYLFICHVFEQLA